MCISISAQTEDAQYIQPLVIFAMCLLHPSWMHIFPLPFGSQSPSVTFNKNTLRKHEITRHSRYSYTLRAARSGVRALVTERPPGMKRTGRRFDHSIPSSAEVKERIEVYRSPRAFIACYRVKFTSPPPLLLHGTPNVSDRVHKSPPLNLMLSHCTLPQAVLCGSILTLHGAVAIVCTAYFRL